MPAGQGGASVALIVPLLNEASTLPACLERLRVCGADELLLVDGGSSDGSRELLEQSGLDWLDSPAGRASQMNAGAAAASSDILLFLHADTVFDSRHLADVRQAMRDPAVVGGRFDVRLSGKHPAFRAIAYFINLRSRLTRISTGDQAMFVCRDVFAALGGFADIPLMEDVELSRRLKRQGEVACLRRRVTTSSRRWEKQGIVRTVLLMWKMRLLFRLGVSPTRLAAMYRDAR